MNNFSAKLRRLMNRIAIPNLMYYICFTQGLVYVADLLTQNQISSAICFYRPLILQGQVWRVLTFLAEPINPHPIWIIFSIIFYITSKFLLFFFANLYCFIYILLFYKFIF